MRHDALHHPWLYVIVVLIAVALLSACATSRAEPEASVEINSEDARYTDEGKVDRPPLLKATGSDASVAYVTGKYYENQGGSAQEQVPDARNSCAGLNTATGEEACVQEQGETERLRMALASGGGQSKQKDDGIRLFEIEAQKEIAAADRRQGWIMGAINVGANLLGLKWQLDSGDRRSAQQWRAFETLAQEGGDSSNTFGDIDGTVNLANADHGSQAGRDVDQQGAGNIGGDKADVTQSRGTLAGKPGIACGGPGDIQGCPTFSGPSDDDEVTSDTEVGI